MANHLNSIDIVEISTPYQRIDVIIPRYFPLMSRALVKKLGLEEKIWLDKKLVRAGDKVKHPGTISFEYDLTALTNVPIVDLEILFENEDFVAIDKPKGLITHNTGRYWDEPSVASWLKHHTGKTDSLADRAGIVHRLDRATSGVLICAKNADTLQRLQDMFKKHQVQKTYLAVSEIKKINNPNLKKILNDPRNELTKLQIENTETLNKLEPIYQYIIDLPLAKIKNAPTKWGVVPNGKPSQTEISVLGVYDKKAIVKLKPKTGRTHQLRVHLNAIGLPISGDHLYISGISKIHLDLRLLAYSIEFEWKDQKIMINSHQSL